MSGYTTRRSTACPLLPTDATSPGVSAPPVTSDSDASAVSGRSTRSGGGGNPKERQQRSPMSIYARAVVYTAIAMGIVTVFVVLSYIAAAMECGNGCAASSVLFPRPLGSSASHGPSAHSSHKSEQGARSGPANAEDASEAAADEQTAAERIGADNDAEEASQHGGQAGDKQMGATQDKGSAGDQGDGAEEEPKQEIVNETAQEASTETEDAGDEAEDVDKEEDGQEDDGSAEVEQEASSSAAPVIARRPGVIDPASEEWPNTVALCSMMKDEQPDDIIEWLQYHRWLGVDRIVLRENGPQLDPRLVPRVQSFVDSGFLDLDVWGGTFNQRNLGEACSKPQLAGTYSWIGFPDVDEFLIMFDNGMPAEEPDLKGFLKRNKHVPGFAMRWLVFGTAGHIERPSPGGPLRYFDSCHGSMAPQTKCLANMWHAGHPMQNHIHTCVYLQEGDLQDNPVLFTDGTPNKMLALDDNPDHPGSHFRSNPPIKNGADAITKDHGLVLFHYMSRSMTDFVERKINRATGPQSMGYASGPGEDPWDPEVMKAHEDFVGMRGDAEVCKAVAAGSYVERCCSSGE